MWLPLYMVKEKNFWFHVSPATITKMGKNGHVTTEVLLKICTALDCGIDDIMEITATKIYQLSAILSEKGIITKKSRNLC